MAAAPTEATRTDVLAPFRGTWQKGRQAQRGCEWGDPLPKFQLQELSLIPTQVRLRGVSQSPGGFPSNQRAEV